MPFQNVPIKQIYDYPLNANKRELKFMRFLSRTIFQLSVTMFALFFTLIFVSPMKHFLDLYMGNKRHNSF